MHSRHTRRTLAGLLLLMVAAPPATAQPHALDGAPPVMHGVKLHDGRHALLPQFGVTLNDPYERNLLAGLAWRYYFASWVGIGVDVWGGGAVQTSLAEDINRELSRGNQAFELSTSNLTLLAGATVEIVPFAGKAMVFGDKMVRVDLHLSLGVGVAMVSGSGRIDDQISVAPNFGVGLRFFPSDWLAIGIDLKDYLISRVLASRRDGSVPGATFGHNWLLGLSVGFFFPTEPEIDRE